MTTTIPAPSNPGSEAVGTVTRPDDRAVHHGQDQRHGHPRILCFGNAFPEDGGLGGSPATVACALAGLGTPVAFLGRIGDGSMRDMFAARGVDTSSCTDTDLTPAGLAEAAQPLLRGARWLLVASNALRDQAGARAMELLLHRATAQGVHVAFDIAWTPAHWGLPDGAEPTAEVLRRLRPFLEVASLIRCTDREARWFLGSDDPTLIHASLAKRPAVFVHEPVESGSARFCLGGRSGSLPAPTAGAVDARGAGEAFLAAVLDGLCRRPELLGEPRPGGGGIADPGELEALLRYAAACGALAGRHEGVVDALPDRDAVDRFLRG